MPFQKKLESLPQRQMGVRESANVRMKKMARPVCPIQDDPDKPGYTGEPNCQRLHNNYPGWWDYCANQGHDPYFSKVPAKTVTENILSDKEGEEGLIIGRRERQVGGGKKLNMVQVVIDTRHNSGRGERYSKGLKGRKELSEFGYAEKCEYRNCEIDAKLQTRYGMFCNDRHARLIGAAVEGMMLATNRRGSLQREANKDLRDLELEYEGAYVLQQPPDLEGEV